MKLPVLVQYLVYHAQPSGRVIQKPAFEIVEFDVASPTTEEAPVAVRWNDAPHDTQIDGWDTWDENGDGHTRWFNGTHWRPLYPENVGHGPVRAIGAEALSDLSRSGEPIRHFLGNWVFGNSHIPKARADEFTDELRSREVQGSRDAAIHKVREALDKLAVVDGVVYRMCHEPQIIMIQAIENEEAARAGIALHSMRIVTEEVEIRVAIGNDPDRVAPLTRFDVLHDMNRLFDRYGSTVIDETRRPQVEVWESIDEDAYWDRVGAWRMQQFTLDNSRVSIGSLSDEQISAFKDAKRAIAIDDRDDRLEAFERVAADIVATWPEYKHADSLRQLSHDLAAREIDVPLARASNMRPSP